MIGNKVLLDTNIISAIFKRDSVIAEKVDAAHEVYIPVTVLGELYFGAQNSINIQNNIADINNLITNYEVLNINEETALIYGNLKVNLKRKGRPIPENDIWIATIAIQHQLTLITRDKHFNEVEGLIIENW